MESQSSAVPTGSKKRTFRSTVWEHFTWMEDSDPKDPKSKCNYCEQQFACHSIKIGTSNLTRHLRTCKKYKNVVGPKQTTLPFGKIVDDVQSSSKTSTSFTQAMARDALARMIITEELPMRIVEWDGFHKYSKALNASFAIPSRRTVARDIEKIYRKEKGRLKDFMKKNSQRVCLTTDTWTSNQNICYMALTCHFIDDEWKVQKKILNFCKVTDHKGETLSNQLQTLLQEWSIEKLCTVTVDNAASNDVAIVHLGRILRHGSGLFLNGEYLHVRCFAHVLNLIVSDDLKEHKGAIDRVRTAVVYVKSSPQRLQTFKSCIESLKIEFKGNVTLDVPTRWNSMFLMLSNAEKYSKAFVKLGDSDKNFQTAMAASGLPTEDDWAEVQEFCKFLKVFYDTTVKVSASLHITAHRYISEITAIKITIGKYILSDNLVLSGMASGMLNKFNKYWGTFEKINMILFIALLLDPSCKSKLLKHCLSVMFGADKEPDLFSKVEAVLDRLYVEYKGADNSGCSAISTHRQREQASEADDHISAFFGSEAGSSKKKTEIRAYLDETYEDYAYDYDVLGWWKMRARKYPVLTRIARDVLAIPISTVASESAFSCGGRVVDLSRSSLLPSTVEAIICSQSWIRSGDPTFVDSPSMDYFETIDEEIEAYNNPLLSDAENLEDEEDVVFVE